MCLYNPLLKQIWTVSAVLIANIGQGMVLGHTGVLLPALRNPESPIKIDLESASWLTSSVGFTSWGGMLISAFTMDYLGRRKSFIVSIIPGIIGWLLIYISENFTTLFIGRCLCGVTSGAVVILGAMIIGEYTTPKYRGMFLNLKSAGICLGSTFIHAIGSIFHWKTTAILAFVLHVISFIIVCTWPESPVWLAMKRQFDKSEEAFIWLRGKDTESRKEFQNLIKAQNEKVSNYQERTILNEILESLKKFTRKDFLQPVFVIFFAVLLLETSGRHYFQAYVMEFASVITGNTIESYYYVIGTDIIVTVGAICSSFLMGIMKRRTLLLSTGFSALIFMILGTMYLFLVSNGILSNNYSWIPVTLFLLFFFFANLGCSPVPLTLLGELFPTEVKKIGSIASGAILSILLTGTLKITPYLLVSLNVYGTFGLFALIMTVSLLTLYFIMPETKDKTLQEIEDYFNYGCFEEKDDNDDFVNVKMLNKDEV